MLIVEKLNVAYGDIQVLYDVSFRIPKIGFFGVLGSNGAGKSTLLKVISGLHHPLSGEIWLDNINLIDQGAYVIPKLGVAHVPEGRHVFPSLTVKENLVIGDYSKRLGNQREDTLAYIFDIFPKLKERENQLGASLSGGEQQMLVVGRALMLHPRLLMLDEPSLGLAPIIVNEMYERLAQIHKEWELTILLIEQNASEALEVIDEAIILENGKVTFHGSAKEIQSTSYIKESYLGI